MIRYLTQFFKNKVLNSLGKEMLCFNFCSFFMCVWEPQADVGAGVVLARRNEQIKPKFDYYLVGINLGTEEQAGGWVGE